MTLPRVNTGTYDKMAVREQYRTHLRLIQKSHPAIVAVSGLDHPPGGFLFPEWVALFTGIRTQRLINAREREELVVRFFCFLETYDAVRCDLPKWRDRPREYIFEFVEATNRTARKDPSIIERLKDEFGRMVKFVGAAFPYGFRKTVTARQVPRARYEAISVGSGLALRDRSDLSDEPIQTVDWAGDHEFLKVTTSDAANVRSKVIGRFEFVRRRLARP